MKSISVLDCTLRDGGYCNQWKFGKENILEIVTGLVSANVDYIECGFLTNQISYDDNSTQYTDLTQVSHFLSRSTIDKTCLVMINYGEYEIDLLPFARETHIDGIRVAFHKKDMEGALAFCRAIKDKGYLVFLQPMVSMSYSEKEFISLLREVNKLRPHAFYIVDSFGMMKRKELMHFLDLVERNLEKDIVLGFHAHNNMQLAYSNAQYLVESPMPYLLG